MKKIMKKLTSPIDLEFLIGKAFKSVEIKDYSWFFSFSNKILISTEAPWRFRKGNKMVISSEDHGHQFGLPEPLDAVKGLVSYIVDVKITSASIEPSTGDLTLKMGNNNYIQFLQLSCGYESWRLTVGKREFFCQGGGQIASFG